MPTRREPYLLVIRSGPYYAYDILTHFGETFGSTFDGELVTFGPEPIDMDLGRFRVRILPQRGPPNLGKRLRYLVRVLWRAVRARWLLRRPLVVITYDPFQSGIIGLVAKWMTGGRFICEVNGIYGHKDTLIDIEDPGVREAKRTRMLKVGSFVLRRATVIKLLFPQQLEGFSLPADRPPRVSFFDLVHQEQFEPQGVEPEKQLLFVGHPFLLKGVDVLLQAFGRVSEEFPDWSLLIIGWQIEESASKGSFPTERVRFLGPQSAQDLSVWMESSKALVLPSRSEGMGRVLLEAAFKGRARIGSRIGGIPSVIEDGIDGLLFESGSVDGLEHQLRRFMADPDLQARLGVGALRRARKEFTADEYLRRYEEVISLALAKDR
ncbi:glycosyltransferase family 4 protein [Gemmatimonadota bacterium]